MGQLNTCSEINCHFFVKVKFSNCELPCGASSPCPRNNGSDSQPIDKKSVDLHTLASMILMVHINSHIGHFWPRMKPHLRAHGVFWQKSLSWIIPSWLWWLLTIMCAFEHKLTHNETTIRMKDQCKEEMFKPKDKWAMNKIEKNLIKCVQLDKRTMKKKFNEA